MTVWRLIVQEVLHRKLNFGLGLLSVVTAVGCLVGALTLLRGHDLRTEQIISQKEAETAERLEKVEAETADRMQKLEDDFRRITKDMGFNVLILPSGQSLEKFFADGYATQYMPEDYANRLADSKIMTINHLLPSLHQEVEWPEFEQTLATPIVLIGTRGQVPLMHRGDPKKPIQEAVPPGTMVVGYRLARSLDLSEGDSTTFMGREFTVEKVHSERGSKDDITVWIDLAEAQELLDKQGAINAILALECYCGDEEDHLKRLENIRQEIGGILPDTQVIEFATQVIARAESRRRAEVEAQASLAAERRNREETLAAEKRSREAMKQQQESFAAVLVPVVIAGCAVWLAFLSFMNVRARSGEIGILRAIGVRSPHILSIFLGKALLLGLVGASLGYIAGFLIGAVWGEFPAQSVQSLPIFDPAPLVLALVLAPLLSVLASWVPAVLAARQDPAIVLREE